MKLSSMIFLGAEAALIVGLGRRDTVLITTGIVFFIFYAFAEIAAKLWIDSARQTDEEPLPLMNDPTQELPPIPKDNS